MIPKLASGPAGIFLVLSGLSGIGCDASDSPPEDATASATSSSGEGGSAGATTVTSGAGGDRPEDRDPAPGGIRRLLPSQIVGSLSVVLGGPASLAAIDVPSVEQLSGFASIGAAEIALTATDVGEFETLANNAALAALADRTRIIDLAPCVGDEEPEETCFEDVARGIGRVAWRRPLEDVEVERLVDLARAGRDLSEDRGQPDPFSDGLRFELSALIQSPSFLYQIEIGVPDPTDLEEPIRRVLTPHELASRVSFFIQGRTPSVQLLDDAEAGRLDTPDGVRAVARELLDRDSAKLALDAFYAELLFLDDLATLNKEEDLFPIFGAELAASMREETRLFLRDLVWARNGDAREMFTATETFVDPQLAELYGVEPAGDGFAKRALPSAQERSGLLGQASLLARFSHPGATSATRRGAFISGRFLCTEIPPPPAGVVTDLPEDPDNPETAREKLTRHSADPLCVGCHSVMDPIGLTLEHFDAIGAYRADDRGLPLDTSGNVESLGTFSGPRELGQRIAEDERASTCMVQNFVRSSLGHIESGGERYAVRDLDEAFAASGYRLQDLMVELAASDLFRYVGDPK